MSRTLGLHQAGWSGGL